MFKVQRRERLWKLAVWWNHCLNLLRRSLDCVVNEMVLITCYECQQVNCLKRYAYKTVAVKCGTKNIYDVRWFVVNRGYWKSPGVYERKTCLKHPLLQWGMEFQGSGALEITNNNKIVVWWRLSRNKPLAIYLIWLYHLFFQEG